MRLISDIVDRLRVESKSMGTYGTDYMATLLMRAADTIEMLSEKVSADRPQGEWEIVTQGWHSIRRCSNCKWTQTYSDPKYMGYRYNYCPNCGARMKGADDE